MLLGCMLLACCMLHLTLSTSLATALYQRLQRPSQPRASSSAPPVAHISSCSGPSWRPADLLREIRIDISNPLWHVGLVVAAPVWPRLAPVESMPAPILQGQPTLAYVQHLEQSSGRAEPPACFHREHPGRRPSNRNLKQKRHF